MTTENLDNNTSKYLKKVTIVVEDCDGNTETIVLDQNYDYPDKIKGAISIGMTDFNGGYEHNVQPLLTGSIVQGITDGPMNVVLSFEGRFGFNLERNKNADSNASTQGT